MSAVSIHDVQKQVECEIMFLCEVVILLSYGQKCDLFAVRRPLWRNVKAVLRQTPWVASVGLDDVNSVVSLLLHGESDLEGRFVSGLNDRRRDEAEEDYLHCELLIPECLADYVVSFVWGFLAAFASRAVIGSGQYTGPAAMAVESDDWTTG